MTPLFLPHKGQSGFSLIELMIASVIGLLLTSAMLIAYVTSARTYQLQDAMSEVQENGRFAIHALLRDLRQSGVGISGNPIIEGVFNTAVDITEFEAIHSDLVINQGSVRSDIVYLPGLGIDGFAYYVGATGVGRIALYRNRDALVEGVTEMVVEYGVDADADKLVDNYKVLASLSAVDRDNIISARVYLLISSSGTGVVDQAQQLAAPFDVVDTSDRRLYQMFAATALIRNALVVKGIDG
ncbi:PilW family protein [Amphritea japonica]|uniref:Type IV pilus assembly protein PilW n=1 Tax=Amphritea japonica ATCC BAA-1530 TaxID=1278309 RepID=A0A7R6PQN2_9GAMM|nr:PilW family protein [Amphritea japonica]BBB27733.1 type IV pilus assembly protein PilW [Amphritea japonica ATCC BAA-1530]